MATLFISRNLSAKKQRSMRHILHQLPMFPILDTWKAVMALHVPNRTVPTVGLIFRRNSPINGLQSVIPDPDESSRPESMLEFTTMKSAAKMLMNFLNDDSGQNLIEYALVAGLIGLGAVVAMTSLGTKIGTAFNTVGSQLTSAL